MIERKMAAMTREELNAYHRSRQLAKSLAK
jgi:hypothetical protein